ncbi:MAG: hypothetical protein ACTHKL_21745 [Streptosporangiaceae bacterium]
MPGVCQGENLGSGQGEVIELANEQLADSAAEARPEGPGDTSIETGCRCRSEAPADAAPNSWALITLLLVAATGTWIGRFVILHAPDAARFTGDKTAALELWAGLIGGFCGYSLAAGVVMTRWSWQVLTIFRPRAPFGSAVRWALATGLILVTVRLATSGTPVATLNGHPVHLFSGELEAITIAGGVVALPGLVGFLALRSLAGNDNQWDEEPRCQILMVARLRQHLRRLLGAFGLFLTLLVVTTAARRQVVLTFSKHASFPQEYVLLYGLISVAVLALFYVSAAVAIDRRCERLLGRYAPVPDPDAEEISVPLKRRQDLSAVLGLGASWQNSFQNGIVVFAPLLTALIGTALPR